eukprot:891053-Pyramimonas_sp.AAC.1
MQPYVDHGTTVATHAPVNVAVTVCDIPTWKRVHIEPLGFGSTAPTGCAYYTRERDWRCVHELIHHAAYMNGLQLAWDAFLQSMELELASRWH